MTQLTNTELALPTDDERIAFDPPRTTLTGKPVQITLKVNILTLDGVEEVATSCYWGADSRDEAIAELSRALAESLNAIDRQAKATGKMLCA